MELAEAKARRDRDITAALNNDGWLSRPEAEALYDLAREARGPIVEIGSFHGRSTAALALGSMAGNHEPVYAIDPFIGPQKMARPTAHGSMDAGCSPERLRANLDRAGVNGLVQIVPKTSAEAAPDIPECALLFIDGDHTYEAVSRDIELYLPKLRMGGMVVFHDVTAGDPGVPRAIDDHVMSHPEQWRIIGRVDSAIVAQRVPSVEKRVIALGCPGRSFGWGSVEGILQASLGLHEVRALNSGNGWDDFNAIWAAALNMVERGEATHFAMLHSDVVPDPGWLDMLMDELEIHKADLVSVAIPIKDRRGVMSCGLGDLSHRWGAFRRLTVREVLRLPPTFSLADTPHPDKVLLHNTGCWVCDLRNPLFFATNPDGSLKCFFDFPTRITRNEDGQWAHARESEDWFFSRQLHELGAKTFITRKVRLSHVGEAAFVNYEPWGTFRDGDEQTAARWRTYRAD